MELTPKELGAYLKNVRENLKYSTYDVNKLCNISQSHLSLMENGKRKPSAIILKKLAPIYNLNYLDLYEKAGFVDLIDNEKKKNSKQVDLEIVSFLFLFLEKFVLVMTTWQKKIGWELKKLIRN